ncbi:MAG: radical SAM protein [Gammaproteobacteria bacterium]|nr:radical SAM protein [Gammaproteobacteria bacterium]
MIAFGPVPSRRLGRSLGVNNIPPKHCTYSCLYCQVGPTVNEEIVPRAFYEPEEIRQAVESRVKAVSEAGESIDYLTFVPDGEPTLDVNLGTTIELLRPLGIKIAVISNGSLIWHKRVQETLRQADWVSLKVDCVEDGVWRGINRPHPDLELKTILSGMLDFASGYKGLLTSETMLVGRVNVTSDGILNLAEFLHKFNPHKAYLSIPTRPPAEAGCHSPGEEQLNRVYQIVKQYVADVEYLTGYEGDAFASSGDPVKDILSIAAVHPMREDAVRELLKKTGSPWDIVEGIIEQGKLRECVYEGRKFYVRRFSRINAFGRSGVG